jgi:hypothetical protein
MMRVLAIPLLILAVVLIASPAARAKVQDNLIPIILYGGVIVAGLLVITGRIHWLVAAGWVVMAALRRILPWLGQLPWIRWLGQRWLRSRSSRSQHGDKERDQANGAGAATKRGPMSAAEARETLGVGPEAGKDEIREAHRRLIQRAHPDRGGSPGLAQRVNEARAVLLGETSRNRAA